MFDNISEEKLAAIWAIAARNDLAHKLQIDPSTLSDRELDLLRELHDGPQGKHLNRGYARSRRGGGKGIFSWRVAAQKNGPK